MNKISFLLLAALLFGDYSIAQTETSPVSNPKVTCMAFTPNDQKMVSGYEDGTFCVWNGEGKLLYKKLVETGGTLPASPLQVRKIAISPDGKRIAVELSDCRSYQLDRHGKFVTKNTYYGSKYIYSHDSRYLFLVRGPLSSFMRIDTMGNTINDVVIKPHLKNNKKEDPDIEIQGFSVKQDGGVIAVCRFTMNQKKNLYDYWIYTFNPNMDIISRVRIPFNPLVQNIKLSTSSDCSLGLIHGWYRSEHTVEEGFYYNAISGSIIRAKIESTYDYNLTPDGSKVVLDHYSSYDIFDTTLNKTLNVFEKPNFKYESKYYLTMDAQKVVLAFNDKPLEMYSLISGKLFDFDNSKTVEDTYTYEPPKQQFFISSAQTTTKPQIDLSGLAAFAKITYTKTLETKLEGCIAGDCFYGFGYIIDAVGKTEYIGNFKNGAREGLGQVHIVDNNIIYSGFFENNLPNGYGNINYYANTLIEVGTFKNTMQDGEFTIYKFDNMNTVLMKGDEITSITRKTRCISGDCTNGNGVYQKEDGSRYEGDFIASNLIKGVKFENKKNVGKYESLNEKGEYNGKADIFWANGLVEHGSYLNGQKNGSMLLKMPLKSKILFVEGTFENGIGVNITIQFRDGRKWVGKQDAENSDWATGTGVMTYPDGTTKTGKFKNGEFVSE